MITIYRESWNRGALQFGGLNADDAGEFLKSFGAEIVDGGIGLEFSVSSYPGNPDYLYYKIWKAQTGKDYFQTDE